MNQLEHLTARYLDAALTPEERSELAGLLEQDPQEARHLAELILQSRALEAHYRQNTEKAADAIMSELLNPENAFVHDVMEEIGVSRTRPFTPLRSLWLAWIGSRAFCPWGYAAVPIAVLLLSLGFWCFSPTIGEPVLTGVSGSLTILERTGETYLATNGMPLMAGDVLRTSSNGIAEITFGAESTRLIAGPATELSLASQAPGKGLALRAGRLEAQVARQRPFAPLVVRTPNAEAVVVGTKFTLTASTNRTRLDVAEGRVRLVDTTGTNAGAAVKVGAGHYAVVAAATELAALPETRGLLLERWTNWPDTTMSSVTSFSAFAKTPDDRQMIEDFETVPGLGDNYIVRIRGFLHPPVTGEYTFWIAANDYAVLSMSPDAQPANKVQVLAMGGTRSREWDHPHQPRSANRQKSETIQLVAGRIYFVEAVLKAGVGGDHLAVAWRLPGGGREIIRGAFLSPATPEE